MEHNAPSKTQSCNDIEYYKEELDKLDFVAVANEFVSDSEHHKRFFAS